MNLNKLKNEKKKNQKRIGRGESSGKGKTSGKGHKGQKARSGYKTRIGFEGGQNPLQRRLPKRGFSNYNFEERYAVINVSKLNSLRANSKVTIEKLKEEKLLKSKYKKLKIIGNDEVSKKLNVYASKFSKGAKEAIEKAGGKAEVV